MLFKGDERPTDLPPIPSDLRLAAVSQFESRRIFQGQKYFVLLFGHIDKLLYIGVAF